VSIIDIQIHRLNKGIAVGKDYLIDPSRFDGERSNFVSHAHFDHIPNKCSGESVASTKLTADLVSLRKNFYITNHGHSDVDFLESGHVPGSTMFLFDGEERVLVTGDFATEKSYFSEGAKPVKVDALVLETTFGFPDYVFPKKNNVFGEARDWIEDSLKKDVGVVLMGYPLGKAQQICHFLDESGYSYSVDERISKVNGILEENGLGFNGKISELSKESRIHVSPMVKLGSPALQGREDWKRAAFSGWAIHPGYRFGLGADAAFPLSDHCDYPSLIRFVKDCDPEVVYTYHGQDDFFAGEVKRQLGIEAMTLPKEGALAQWM